MRVCFKLSLALIVVVGISVIARADTVYHFEAGNLTVDGVLVDPAYTALHAHLDESNPSTADTTNIRYFNEWWGAPRHNMLFQFDVSKLALDGQDPANISRVVFGMTCTYINKWISASLYERGPFDSTATWEKPALDEASGGDWSGTSLGDHGDGAIGPQWIWDSNDAIVYPGNSWDAAKAKLITDVQNNIDGSIFLGITSAQWCGTATFSQPYVDVYFVPEPSTLVLGLMAFCGMMLFRRFRG
jgi:hypothetical protein